MTESIQPGDPYGSQPDDRYDDRPRPENRSRYDNRPDDLDDISRRIRLGSQPLASLGQRFVGALVDGFLGLLTCVPGFVLLMSSNAFRQGVGRGGGGGPVDEQTMMLGIGLMAIFYVPFSIYQMYLLSVQGQTLGKKVVGTRIVKMDDQSNPGFVGAVLLRAWIPGFIGAVPYVGGCFSLIDILVIFGQERRCIHDMIAGTIVIEAEARKEY